MQDITRGQTRVRAWPETRGKPKSKAEKEAQDAFRTVQKAAAYLAPGCLAYIHEATKDSPLLVRDVVTMQLYNRWFGFVMEDGKVLMPMTAINDISAALDVLGSQVDDLLVRTPEGWRAVPRKDLLSSTAFRSAAIILAGSQSTASGATTRITFDQKLFGDADLIDLTGNELVVPPLTNRADVAFRSAITAGDTGGYISFWIYRKRDGVITYMTEQGNGSDFYGFISMASGPLEVQEGDRFGAYMRANPGIAIGDVEGESYRPRLSASFWNE